MMRICTCWIFILVPLISNSQVKKQSSKKNVFSISVRYYASKPEASLYLLVQNSFFDNLRNKENLYEAEMGKDSIYRFRISTDKLRGRFLLYKKKDTTAELGWAADEFIDISPALYWDANDDVKIIIRKKSPANIERMVYHDNVYEFSGRGAKKYQILYEAESLYKWTRVNLGNDGVSDTNYYFPNPSKYKVEAALSVIEKNKNRLSPYYYNIIEARILFEYYRFKGSEHRFNEFISNKHPDTVALYKKRYITDLDKLFQPGIPSVYLSNSQEYIWELYKKINFETHLLHPDADMQQAQFSYITTKVPAVFRDKLLVHLFQNTDSGPKTNELYGYSLKNAVDKEAISELKKMKSRLPGMKAFNFSLADDNDNRISLDSFKGKVVLVDFWFTSCAACAFLSKNVLKKLEAQYENEPNIAFANISIDTKKSLWKKSLSTHQYSSERSINLYTDGIGADHQAVKAYNVSGYPTLVVINPDGTIAKYYTGLPTFNADEFMSELKGIIEKALNKIVKK